MPARQSTPRRPRSQQAAPASSPEPQVTPESVEGPQATAGAELVLYTPADSTKPKRAFVVTPFQAHKLVNDARKALGLVKPIPPQMMYNYAAKGLFQTGISEDGRKVVDRDSFEAWLVVYLTKAAKLAAKAA